MMLMIMSSCLFDGHKVGNLSYSVKREKTCDENIRLREIKLLLSQTWCISRSNTEKTTFLDIEQGTKDGGRVETRQATPVDRAIYTYQRYCVKIADNRIIFNWLICF